jgi:hypothetical protein
LELENKKLGVDMVQKMSLRGWVIALLSFIACLLLVNKRLFPEALRNRVKTLNSEGNDPSTAVADPMQDSSQWNSGLKQGRANSKPLPPASDLRSDSRFSGAIDTFDHIQLTMDKLPSKYGNARKYLNGLKEKLFIDDYRFIATSLGVDCAGAKAAFDQVNGAIEVRAERRVPDAGAGMGNVQSNVLADHCKRLIEESGNPGYSNVAGVFLSRGIEGASQNQLLLDAVIYVAAKTDLEQVLEEDIRHDAGIRKRLDAEFGDQKIGEEWAKVAEESVSESNHVLDAYQSIFQRRLTRHLGAAGDGIMEALGQLKLNNVNFLELSVPCN